MGLKSQPTFYAGNAVQQLENGKGVLIRLASQKFNYKMGNENNKVAERKENGYEDRILNFFKVSVQFLVYFGPFLYDID